MLRAWGVGCDRTHKGRQAERGTDRFTSNGGIKGFRRKLKPKVSDKKKAKSHK